MPSLIKIVIMLIFTECLYMRGIFVSVVHMLSSFVVSSPLRKVILFLFTFEETEVQRRYLLPLGSSDISGIASI